MSQIKQLVLASNNAGKLAELSDMLAPSHIEVLPQSAFDISDADETGLSFVENAILKARHAARISGLPALADDSGLAVDALGGAPGIYSARYAGEHGNDAANNAKLLQALDGIEHRSAQFVCALALVRHADDPLPIICEGLWRGQILTTARGDNGFGYDPLFQPDGMTCASAELSKAQKNAVSHRALALKALVARLGT
ncbi:RdgB/HAM1 family non-canonical purine NTP pyrophosphatase [Simiduia agarivorans]|uniref:dITP/XTP pyrophosphatase n=1 Tax=Simiduia agarivorans (strain DSM 21679 / JCM 13881 / BCRC 17597 / SA1) TaxID=1117647 RepID=K4KMJ0_SIMAS|nr:RdgB/HAM1 family non-canonical purine NTP pyrophosphatase [Simiduia agarivorans]AFU99445.1 dITP/XTP pyrophosphatase [Simiduia agarivorans SA1 = DSM 21679]